MRAYGFCAWCLAGRTNRRISSRIRCTLELHGRNPIGKFDTVACQNTIMRFITSLNSSVTCKTHTSDPLSEKGIHIIWIGFDVLFVYSKE